MSTGKRLTAYWTGATLALQRILLSALPLLFFVLHATGLLPLEFIQRIENYLYDVRVEFMMPRVVDPRVVIVDIDEASLAAEGQWPWPRQKVAALVDALFDGYGVRTLGFDALFAEPERPEALRLIDELSAAQGGQKALAATLAGIKPRYEGDRIFSESLIARDTVLGFVFKPHPGQHERAEVGLLPPAIASGDERIQGHGWLRPGGYVANLPELQQSAAGGGFFDTPLTDEDGVVRRAPLFQSYGGELYGSLAFSVARLAQGSPPVSFAFDEGDPARLAYVTLGDTRIALDAQGAVLIPFRGPLGSFRYVSATDVLKGKAPADA